MKKHFENLIDTCTTEQMKAVLLIFHTIEKHRDILQTFSENQLNDLCEIIKLYNKKED